LLVAGSTLGPYKTPAPLGAGGMGEVYRAHDTRLGRDAAIKVAPPRLAVPPEVEPMRCQAEPLYVPCRNARRVGRSVVLLLVATLVPTVSLAQSTSDTTSIGALYDRMPPSLSLSTPEGRTIRVMLGSRTLVCHSPRFTPAGIGLSPSGPGGPGYSMPTLLPWKEVDRIDVRGNSVRTGAVIGTVAVGAAVASDPFLGKGSNAGGVLALTAMGAVTGAGALVGSSIPSWKNVYRRDAQTETKSGRSTSSRGTRP